MHRRLPRLQGMGAEAPPRLYTPVPRPRGCSARALPSERTCRPRLLRRAAAHGYEPGANCLGGAYAVGPDLLARHDLLIGGRGLAPGSARTSYWSSRARIRSPNAGRCRHRRRVRPRMADPSVAARASCRPEVQHCPLGQGPSVRRRASVASLLPFPASPSVVWRSRRGSAACRCRITAQIARPGQTPVGWPQPERRESIGGAHGCVQRARVRLACRRRRAPPRLHRQAASAISDRRANRPLRRRSPECRPPASISRGPLEPSPL